MNIHSNSEKILVASTDVLHALENKTPLVALESTVITHGMPFPQNLEMAVELEEILINSGVTPAFIAIIDGVMRVGLSRDEIRMLSTAAGVMKAGTREIATAIHLGRSAGTTVSATIRIASFMEIKIFATGGIGGVHRDYLQSMDVSSDLTELANSKMIVVCSGAKSILDIPKTFEVLESLSVPVVVFGSDQIPGFYLRETHIKSPLRLDNVDDIVGIYQIRKQLWLNGSVLVLNPINKECELHDFDVDEVVESSLDAAFSAGISGQDMTPFILDNIVKLTNGESLRANLELIKNNVRLSASIAQYLA